MLRRFLCWLLTFVLTFVLYVQTPAIADTYNFPMAQAAETPTPNWSQVTFDSFPTLEGESTGILNNAQILKSVGYNPSRSWGRGSSLVNVLKVGDLYNFGLGSQTVSNILGNTNLSQVSLGSFSALNAVSLNGLLKAVPALKNLPVSSLPLAKSLFSGDWSNAASQGISIASQYSSQIQQFYQNNPTLGSLPIGQIVQGNWEGALSKGAQLGLQQIIKAAPQLSNLPMTDILGAVESGNWQSALSSGLSYGVQRLSQSIPDLQGISSSGILSGMTTGNWRGAVGSGLQKGSQMLLGNVVKQFPELSNIPLGTVLDLDKFSLSSVPGLADTAISKIPGIGDQSIGSIPGLKNVPVSQILDLTQLLQMGFAKVDFLDQAAGKATYALSGSTRDDQFKPESCTGKCPHFEVHDSKAISGISVNGRQWVTAEQQVSGGKGPLGAMNNGKEPTGLVPWGFKPNLKLVATKVNDSKGSIEMALYLRVCVKHTFVDLGCTPFFIGPIPFGSVNEKGMVLIATSSPPPQVAGQSSEIDNILGSSDCISTDSGTNTGDQNLVRYLARIAAGESASGTNIGPNPETGAYGEYQFIAESRNTVLARTGFDPWSTDKTTRDKAALAWISIYGQEQGINIIGAIKTGNFTLADQVLGKNQFTSLPGGAEQSAIWTNAAYVQKFGSNGSCVIASTSTAKPCQEGQVCLLHHPLPSGSFTSGYGYRASTASFHHGIDISDRSDTRPGSAVLAADDGTVLSTPTYMSGCRNYGYRIEIRHPSRGLVTTYNHLASRSVNAGQQVKRGQQIAVEGSTSDSALGCSNPMITHLHFETQTGGGLRNGDFDPMKLSYEPAIR